jgi:hypothetical protein
MQAALRYAIALCLLPAATTRGPNGMTDARPSRPAGGGPSRALAPRSLTDRPTDPTDRRADRCPDADARTDDAGWPRRLHAAAGVCAFGVWCHMPREQMALSFRRTFRPGCSR